mmetsp:Transcript_59096/g.121103  ORF Transcript_59096/g.121103 Transcript_59096/m.121103 type:complete len:155 (-) Transcript_59096:199-663(-)
MPHPVAETGDCDLCGKRGLIYLCSSHGITSQRAACRGCIENGAASQPKESLYYQNTPASQSQRMFGLAQAQHAPVQDAICKASPIYACENTPFNSISSFGSGRMPMSILCCDASDRLCINKRASGAISGSGIYQAGFCETSQCSPHKRQRTGAS